VSKGRALRTGRGSGAALTAALLLSVPCTAPAQQAEDPSPHSDATLVSEVRAVTPGRSFTVALRLTMDPGWHSYWINPGDAGGTTTLDWTLPQGFSAGEIQWPHPRRIEAPPLASYGYDGQVLLLVDIEPPPQLEQGSTVRLAARADWVVCEEICLPATADVELELPVRAGPPHPDTDWATAIERTRRLLPQPAPDWDFTAWRDAAGFVLEIEAPEAALERFDGAYFFAARASTIRHAAPQPVVRDGGRVRISLPASEYLHGAVERLRGVLLAPPGAVWPVAGGSPALAVDAPVTIGPVAATGPVTFWVALLFALVGGLILNLMPCVFPVLSIKVLGFVQQGGASGAAVRAHGLAFAGGVIASFLALGAALLVIRAGGTLVGWGFHLQSPAVVGVLAALFFVLGLGLLGVLQPGTSLTRLGGILGAPDGYGSSFAAGVLATIVATPCIAPLMGAALGFALTRPPLQTLFVFGALGVGMSLPYAVLSARPQLLSRLPRPGAWMETVRQVLAFPLFATSLWLLWVFGRQTGVDGVTYLLVALLSLGVAAWVLWRWPSASTHGRRYAVSRAAVAAAVTLAVVAGVRGAGSRAEAEPDELWRAFSAAQVAAETAAGRPVFIDFTAAWCLTCKVNERVVLETDEILEAFEARDVALFKADWTRQDADITRALEAFGRTGVPLYVLYPGGPERAPVLLPTILTKEILLTALEDI